jgi:transposase-like protein
MNEIICPHCHKAFTIDEAGYAATKSSKKMFKKNLSVLRKIKRTL